MPNTLILQELKRLILLKNGLKTPSPSDCKLISINIQKELKKNVSETTLKRLFGFATIKHQFSQFTINTLMEYVGITDDQSFDSTRNFINLEIGEDIDQVKQKAERITHYTLLNIRNRCSVPYEMTITRRFAKHDFEFFHASKYSFTTFISQPGYGKSILISHLVQEMFLDNNAPFKKDIVVLINADHIFNKDLAELTLEERIKLKLGLLPKTNLVDFFNEQWNNNGIKLILIVDGFSELIFTKVTKPKVFDRIIDFIANIENSESIKLILNMRSTLWNRFNEKIRCSHFLKSKWFSGSYFNLKDNSNVPPLTEIEVKNIFHKMSPLEFDKVSENLKTQLRFPFHIQWYYQLKEEYPDFESYTNIIYYEIISRFINEKIYNSTYSTEKVLFCKKIIYLTNYGRKTYTVLKTDLIKEMPVFKNAYMELLADGILMEEKQIENGFPSEYVRFIQPHIFEYFLFIELYDLFGQQMDDKFFLTVNTEYFGNQSRFQLLQWSVRLLVKLNKFEELKAVLKLKLNNYEKNYLIYFIAENLKYRYKIDATVIEEIKNQQLHALLMRSLIHFDFIDSCYKEAINCLIDVADNEEIALTYHTILAIFDCLSLNQEQLNYRLAKIEELGHEASKWDINPSEIIKLVLYKIKGIPVTDNEVFSKIEDFKSGKDITINELEFPNIKQVLGYLHIFVINLFYGDAIEATKIVKAILNKHPKLVKTRKLFSIYLLNLMAQASARTNPGKKTDQMENILTRLYADGSKVNPTLYATSILLAFKAEQSKNKKDYQRALAYAEECVKIYKRNDLAVNEIFTYNLIINIYNEVNDFEKAEEYTYYKLNLLDQKGADSQLFRATTFM